MKIKNEIEINGMKLKNRLVMPPMASAKADANGHVTQDLLDYYDDKSKSGKIGLIITEHSYIDPQGKAGKGQVSIQNDAAIEGLRQLVKTIHQNGSKVMAQISHAGMRAKKEITGMEPVGPDTLSLEAIERIVHEFAEAARRAKEAGFDGVEIHSAHGYLLNQFYSPLANHRDDLYTGSRLEGRLKLHLEVIEAVRKQVGKDYPIAVRLGACDDQADGTTIEDSVKAAKILEEAGIDLLDISGGMNGYIKPGDDREGYFAELTHPIKTVVSIPVLLTGG